MSCEGVQEGNNQQENHHSSLQDTGFSPTLGAHSLSGCEAPSPHAWSIWSTSVFVYTTSVFVTISGERVNHFREFQNRSRETILTLSCKVLLNSAASMKPGTSPMRWAKLRMLLWNSRCWHIITASASTQDQQVTTLPPEAAHIQEGLVLGLPTAQQHKLKLHSCCSCGDKARGWDQCYGSYSRLWC